MGIPDEDVARVRAATDIVALIGERSALKRQGRRWVGLCPFHQEKSPSFSVNAEDGLYYCFGCQKSGDAITFVRDVEHVDFVEAVRLLADRAGITIREDEAGAAEHRRRAPLYEAMERAVDWYHDRLLTAPDAGPARHYLRSRGYDGEVVRRFRLGWAPDGWDLLARHLRVPDDVLVDTGLGFTNRRGRRQDAMRARVVFPICDPSGRPIALGGRVLPDAAATGPKYKNSQDGPLYAKRRTLYGLNWAKHDVIATGEVVVCEGYTDVIGCFTAGMPRAVATCGTALGEEHFRLLANFARRIVLAYDADGAGQAGAGRVYAWERSHQVEVAVAALPTGSDPADLAREDPEALRGAVAGARPFLQFRLDRVFGAADLSHPEGRARAAEAALAVVAEHPNALVRDQYVMDVAGRCRTDPATLRPMLEELVAAEVGAGPSSSARSRGRGPGSGGDRQAPELAGAVPRPGAGSPHGGGDAATHRGGGDPSLQHRGAARPGPTDRSEGVGLPERGGGMPQRAGLEALRLAVHQPEQVASRLERFLFLDPLQRAAFDALVAVDDLHVAIEHAEQAGPEVAALLRRIAVEEPAADADDVVVQMIRVAARHALGQLRAEATVAPERFAALAAESKTVRDDLQAIEDDRADPAAADRLVAWLGSRGEEDA